MRKYITQLLRPACAGAAIIVISICSAPPAVAGESGAQAAGLVRLADLIDTGLRDNPGIKAKRLSWKAVVERYPQARSLDDPMLSYTQPISEIETRLGPSKRTIALSQRLPYPGRLRVKGEIAAKEAEMARVALDAAARDLVLEIKRAYYDLYYLDEAIRLAKERSDLFEHFTRAERNDYSVGVTGFSEVVSAETRLADAEYELILLTELRRAAESTVNTLLDREPEEPVGAVEPPEVTGGVAGLKSLYDRAGDNEDIVAASLRVEKSELAEELSRYASRPSFTVGLNYTEIGDPASAGLADGGRDAVAVTFGVTLPVWTGRNSAARREARLERESSVQARAALANSLDARVKKAYVDMNSNYRLVRLYADSLLPKAEKLMETAQIMYKNGNGSIADLFESRLMWINFSLAYQRAVSSYLKDRAGLERLTAGYALKEGQTDE